VTRSTVRAARRERLCVIALALLTAALFGFTSLEITAAGWFYGDGADHWPLARQRPWSILYRAAPWLSALLVLGGVAALGASGDIRVSDLTRTGVLRHARLRLDLHTGGGQVQLPQP
jgi:hypothetical protein